VRPGGERPLPAPHDHGCDVGAAGGLDRGLPDLLLHLGVERVQLGPVDADRADATLDLEPDELAHAGAPAKYRRPGAPRSIGAQRRTSWGGSGAENFVGWFMPGPRRGSPPGPTRRAADRWRCRLRRS